MGNALVMPEKKIKCNQHFLLYQSRDFGLVLRLKEEVALKK